MKSRRKITFLFESGRRLEANSLRILYTWEHSGPYSVRMAVSVPKRLFKRAVDRNLLKRRIREAYRHQKPAVYQVLSERNQQLEMVIQYRGRKIMAYRDIETSLKGLLERVLLEA